MSDFRIKTYPVGQIGTNCYVVYRETCKKAVIIDPGAQGGDIADHLKELSVTPEAIFLTHGHFDHILGIEELKREYPGIPVYAGDQEKDLLSNPSINLSAGFGEAYSVHADQYLEDGASVKAGEISFKVLHTPGHTKGSVCYLIQDEDVLISGDTLFLESLGRTDFPTGDQSMIIKSIRERLFPLPGDTLVYPGHGDMTTIGHEKTYNPVALYRG
ncbi:MBL fold metallo-hydrolase [Clostridium sp. HBUAS56010]|uniref:MBL fold metallo-hydrolase n=1 Tax=Clostridium sp. HBUAS56010 TaxID=2571127 RepID=UPI001177E019|nr:MBL fold metallo-hydrolase [Clostridium sp. HBUAS56010]